MIRRSVCVFRGNPTPTLWRWTIGELAPLSDADRRELLELLEDRHELRSTLVTSQLPVEKWYEAIDHPTFADAILDWLVHNAYRIALRGESMRRKKAAKKAAEKSKR